MHFLVNRLRRGGVAFATLCCLSIATSGDATERWPVTGKIIGKKEKKAKDVSGIACSTTSGFPRTCMVVDDNVQHAQLVTLYDGELVANEFVPLGDNSFEGKALELDEKEWPTQAATSTSLARTAARATRTENLKRAKNATC